MKLPKHIGLTISHNQHRIYSETVEAYLSRSDADPDVAPEDRAEMIRTGEIWEIHWNPDNVVGSHWVGAATLERALALADGGAAAGSVEEEAARRLGVEACDIALRIGGRAIPLSEREELRVWRKRAARIAELRSLLDPRNEIPDVAKAAIDL